MDGFLDNLISVLAMSSEPAIIAESGRISYMNAAAVKLVGEDMTGRPDSELLPEPALSPMQGERLMSIELGGREVTAAICPVYGARVYFLRPAVDASGPFSSAEPALRSCLSDMRMAINGLNGSNCERSGIALRRSFHRLWRQLMNVFVVTDADGMSLPCVPMETDIDAFCADLCAAANSFAKKHEAAVIYRGPGAPCCANVDTALTEQMLLNLILNALQHTKPGGEVRVGLTATERDIKISIDDDGEGIPAGELAGAFNGWQGTGERGTGAGLAAARDIALRQGGALMVDSGSGSGTHVRVLLPRSVQGTSFRQLSSPYRASGESVMIGLSNWLTAEDYEDYPNND